MTSAAKTETGDEVRTPEMVTLTIDGNEVSVPKGTLVIRAAELMGIQIPRFCDHPLLEPVGACRQCLVEVEGQRKPMASCTTVATDDMVVRTQLTSEAADKNLSAGDVIVEVAQEAVSSADDIKKRVEQLKKDGKKSVLLLVSNGDGELRFVALNVQ